MSSRAPSRALGDVAIDGGATPVAGRSSDRLAAALVIPLTLVLVVLIGLLYVVFRPVRVDGPSMEPVLLSGDRVLVQPGYGFPRRGDVVVVTDEPRPGEDLIKRVVGVPGDTVEVRDDVAIVNGENEAYGFPLTLAAGTRPYRLPAVTVPMGTVYLMGDNRPVSFDSRDFGPVPVDSVMGRVVAVILPPPRAHALDYGTR
ncbi:MAG: signal peptidase I [Actinobacteria bacterium]|nr:MAG: signal peptidase I [Actinomycetota bacterium]